MKVTAYFLMKKSYLEIDEVKILIIEEVKSARPYVARTSDFDYDNVLIKAGNVFTIFRSCYKFNNMIAQNFPSAEIKGVSLIFNTEEEMFLFLIQINKSDTLK